MAKEVVNLIPTYPALCCPPDKLACKYIRTHLHASISGLLFSHFLEQKFELERFYSIPNPRFLCEIMVSFWSLMQISAGSQCLFSPIRVLTRVIKVQIAGRKF